MRNFAYKALSFFCPFFHYFLRHRLRVLAYHNILDAYNFEEQILWLKSHYHLIDILTLKNHLLKKIDLPKNSLLLTFDDGDKTVFEKGLPILKKYDISSCLFVITGLINSNKDFWWNTIVKNEKKNGVSEAEIIKIINITKSVSNDKRLELLRKYPATYQQQLTIEEVRELQESGCYIGNHSHTHPMFDKIQKDGLTKELEQVRLFFKKNEIGDHRIFAYPNGNFSKDTEIFLKKNDIQVAFLFDHRINEKQINPLRISRIRVDSDTPLSEFKTKVSGMHPILKNLAEQL